MDLDLLLAGGGVAGREGHDQLRLFGDALPSDNYPHLPAYAIFDEQCRIAGPISRMRNPHAYAWSADNSAEMDRGWIVRAAGATELADRLGLDPAVPGCWTRVGGRFPGCMRPGATEASTGECC